MDSGKHLTDEDINEIVEMYIKGGNILSIAAHFAVTRHIISKVLDDKGIQRQKKERVKSRDMAEFASRVKSMLWRQNRGADKKIYNQWKARVEELEADTGAGYNHNQAIVRAAKEFPVLNRLFREFDVRDFDPNPESHPAIQHYGQLPDNGQAVCEGTEQSYRESLRWAIDAAGRHLRTGEIPKSCPCDAAWYLYRQAIDEPKDFMGKVGQIESKTDLDSEARKNMSKSAKKSIAEIDAMLAVITEAVTEEREQ